MGIATLGGIVGVVIAVVVFVKILNDGGVLDKIR